jgi:hypothetical protein
MLSDSEFVEQCGIENSEPSVLLAHWIREEIAQKAGTSFEYISPEDTFRGTLADVRWKEFEPVFAYTLQEMESRFGVKVDDKLLDRVPVPGTGSTQSVRDLFVSLDSVFKSALQRSRGLPQNSSPGAGAQNSNMS